MGIQYGTIDWIHGCLWRYNTGTYCFVGPWVPFDAHPCLLYTPTTACRRNWVLVGITRRTGALKFTFTKGKDVFDTHEEAMQYLQGMGPRLEVSRPRG